jgi:hypothetical protein
MVKALPKATPGSRRRNRDSEEVTGSGWVQGSRGKFRRPRTPCLGSGVKVLLRLRVGDRLSLGKLMASAEPVTSHTHNRYTHVPQFIPSHQEVPGEGGLWTQDFQGNLHISAIARLW